MADRWKQADELSAHVKELNFAAERQAGRGEFIPFRKALVVYLIGLLGTVGSAVLADRLLGINPYAAPFTLCGIVYLSAAAQRPRIVYQVLRQLRWFRWISDPRQLRVLMLVIGVILLLVGLFAPLDRIYPRS